MSCLSWSHTYPIRIGNDVMGRCCSFQTTPLVEGERCSVHVGKLMDPLQGNPKTVVKVFHGHDPYSEVVAEVRKMKLVAEVLEKCPNWMRRMVQVANTYETGVEKVGRGGKLLKKKVEMKIHEEDAVVVQDFVDSQIGPLFNMVRQSHPIPSMASSPPGRNTYNKHSHLGELYDSSVFVELAQKSYDLSNGNYVIGEIEGAAVQDLNGNGRVFQLTSVTLHSRSQEYGQKDQGCAGVVMYEKLSGQPQQRVRASAPPMEDSVFFAGDEWDSSCCSSFSQAGSNRRSRIRPPSYRECRNIFKQFPPMSQPPSYSSCYNVQSPAPRTSPLPGSGQVCIRKPSPAASPSLRQQMPHGSVNCVTAAGSCGQGSEDSRVVQGRSGDGLVVSRQIIEDLLATTPELRSSCTASFVNRVLGPVPGYYT